MKNVQKNIFNFDVIGESRGARENHIKYNKKYKICIGLH